MSKLKNTVFFDVILDMYQNADKTNSLFETLRTVLSQVLIKSGCSSGFLLNRKSHDFYFSEFDQEINVIHNPEFAHAISIIQTQLKSDCIASFANGVYYYVYHFIDSRYFIFQSQERIAEEISSQLIPIIRFYIKSIDNEFERIKRIQIEKELKFERNLLKSVLNSVPHAIYLKDKSFKKVIANEQDLKLAGYTSMDDILGKTDEEVYPNSNNKEIRELETFVLETGKPVVAKMSNIINIQGDQGWFEISKFPFINESGEIDGILGVTENITRLKQTREELRKQSFVASQMLNSVIIMNPDGLIDWVNDGFSRMSGFSKEEVIGLTPTQVFRGEQTNRDDILKILNAFNEKKPIETEILTYRKNGEPFWSHISCNAFYSEEGKYIGYIGIQTDITDVKEAEEQIEKLSFVASQTINAVVLIHKVGVIDWVNDAFIEMTGYDEIELLGKDPILLFKGKETDRQLLEDIQSSFFSKKPIERELILYTKHSIPIWVKITCNPYFSKKGVYMGYLAILTDISELKKAEERIRRLSVVASQTINQVIIFNIKGKIEWVNNSFLKLSDYTLHEIQGKYPTEVFVGPETDVKKLNRLYQLKDQKNSQTGKLIKYNKSGKKYWAEISVSPILNDKGEFEGTISIEKDISLEIEINESLVQAKLIAEKAQESEKSFLANMSHEIRTPLNAIFGMTHFLRETKLSKKQNEIISNIQYSTSILRELISDVLDISKIEAGLTSVKHSPINLHQMMERIAHIFESKLLAKNLKLNVEIDKDLQFNILSDQLMLNQILINLISNAIKFTNEGSIDVHIKILGNFEKSCLIAFEVVDSGIGILNKNIKKIFEKYIQADDNIRATYGGTGLGLYITDKLVRLLGGEIQVNSKLKKGSKFSFDLEFDKESNLQLSNEEQVVDNDLIQSVDFELDYPILIVEDNKLNQSYLTSLLDKWNMPYMLADNGKEGLDLAIDYRFSIILMDLQMPIMDGYESTKKIRDLGLEWTSKVPILAISAARIEDNKQAALEAGMNGFLQKPYSPLELKQMLLNTVQDGNVELNMPVDPSPTKGQDVFQFSKEFDSAILNNLYGNDLSYLNELWNTFLNETTQEIKTLIKHLESENTEQTRLTAHKIKPTFTMIGLPRLTTLMDKLVQEAKQEKVDFEYWPAKIDFILKNEIPLIRAEKEKLALYL